MPTQHSNRWGSTKRRKQLSNKTYIRDKDTYYLLFFDKLHVSNHFWQNGLLWTLLANSVVVAEWFCLGFDEMEFGSILTSNPYLSFCHHGFFWFCFRYSRRGFFDNEIVILTAARAACAFFAVPMRRCFDGTIDGIKVMGTDQFDSSSTKNSWKPAHINFDCY